MKRVINLLLVLVLLTFTFPVLAQEESGLSETVSRNTYGDNWYISIGPSINVLFAEQDKYESPVNRFKFGGELSVGKWFNQNTGMSLNISGGGLRGFNLTEYLSPGYYTGPDTHKLYPMGGDPKDPANNYDFVNSKHGEGFWQDFNYSVVTLDLMGNLTNLFRGRAVEESFFDLAGFVGLGVNVAFDNKNTTPDFYGPAAKIGLRANLNFTKNIGIYFEPAGYFTDPEFDGYKGTAIGDSYISLSAGIQYTFNKRVSSFENRTIDELDRLNRRVNENRDLIENHQDILERQQKLIDKLGSDLSSRAEKPVTVIHKEISKSLPEYVRFSLNSYRIDKSEYSKIRDVADFMKNNPNAKVLLVGYADKLTGTASGNYILSKKRADAVRSELQRLGVNDSRLTIEWKGDKEQPFATNEWNRVVIMVERK